MPASEAAVIAITSGTTICTIVLSRLRCLLRPCDPDGQYSQCGFTDAKLDKSAHELKIGISMGEMSWSSPATTKKSERENKDGIRQGSTPG